MTQKILIVDDDLDTLRLVGLLLQRKGYHITAADNGAQALSKAQAENPDLILLDVMMPELDGVEVLRKLRAAPKTSHIPVIMFTAKSQVDDKVIGFEAGADDYLTKPTHPAELLARVRSILARTHSGASDTQTVSNRPKGSVYCVLSAKGGLGATTFAVNLGLALQLKHGKDAVVAEFRPGVGAAGLMLGLNPNNALDRLLAKNADQIGPQDVKNGLVQHDSGLDLLLSSYQPPDARYFTAHDQFARIIEHLSGHHDSVVVDSGPGFTPACEKIVEKCDKVFLLIEPVYPTLIQTRAMLEELRMKVLNLDMIHMVLFNRVRYKNTMTPAEIQKLLGHSIASVLPAQPELALECMTKQDPFVSLYPDSPFSQHFFRISEHIVH